MRIAMIGAGSVGFTRRLVQDTLAVPELADTTFAFTDISKRNLDLTAGLCKRMIEHNDLPARIESTTDRRAAIEGADVVINTVRVGGMAAYRHDIDIPLTYGVDQCVGDTLGPGGVMYGQRGIPVMLDFCKDIRELTDGALLLNYANPNAMLTWAANQYGQTQCVGLCHGVQHGHQMIGEALGIDWREIEIDCVGINHQTWYVRVEHKGKDLRDKLLPALEAHPVYSKTEKVRIDVLRRFGYLSTESNGHLSEYLPWYRKRPRELRKWVDLRAWIHGETGGYLRSCTERNDWFYADAKKLLAETPPMIGPEDRSIEHGSYIIEAMATGRTYRGHFNVVNRGAVPNLPDDCIVETPGYVDRGGFRIPIAEPLPEPCAATCRVSINVQRMAVQAAVAGDVQLCKLAVLHDPLTGAVCNPDEVWRMVDEMLVAQSKWLPQYRKAIPAAKRRVAQAPPPPRPDYKGATRLKAKTRGKG